MLNLTINQLGAWGFIIAGASLFGAGLLAFLKRDRG